MFDLDKVGHQKYLGAVLLNNKKCAQEKTRYSKVMALNGQMLSISDGFIVKPHGQKAKSR